MRRGAQLSQPVRELYAQQARLYAWLSPTARSCRTRCRGPPPVRAELVLIEIGSDVVDRQEIPVDFAETRGPGPAPAQRADRGLRARQARGRRAPRGGRPARVPVRAAACRPGDHRRGGRALARAARAPPARGDHRHRQDRRRPLPGPALLPGARQAPLRAHRQDPAAGDGDPGARAAQPGGRVPGAAAARQGEDVRQRPGALPRGVLRLRPRLLRQAPELRSCSSACSRHHAYLDPDAVFEAAQAAEVCPFEVSLELAGQVQVTVCDYNYAFDPYVSLSDFGADADLSDVVLVIDEIHNLVDRGRGYYSPELSARAVAHAGETVGRRRRADPPADRGPLRRARAAGSRTPWATCSRTTGRPRGGPASSAPLETHAARGRPVAPAPELRRRLRRLPGVPARDQDVPRRTTPSSTSTSRCCASSTALVVSDDAFSHLALRVGRRRRAARCCARTRAASSGRMHQPHPRHHRPVGHPVAARVLPRSARLRRRAHRRRSRCRTRSPRRTGGW